MSEIERQRQMIESLQAERAAAASRMNSLNRQVERAESDLRSMELAAANMAERVARRHSRRGEEV